MANNFDMFTKKGPTNTSENLPYAFSHISSGAPPSVYMSMMTGNTFDEAMRETNNIPMSPEDLDIDLALDPELDDPDAIEKAIYQLRIAEEKEIEPEEVLETPYGPGLSGEEIDLLLDAYPALDAGVDLDMIDENFDEVDRMLGESGENIEGAMDAVEQRAEDEGEIGSTPAMMRQLGDNLGGSLEAMLHPKTGDEQRLAELYTNSPFDSSGFLGDVSKAWSWMPSEKVRAPLAGPVTKAFNWPFNPKEQYSGEFGSILQIIHEPTDEGDDFTPDQVVDELKSIGLTGPKGADYVARFLATPEGLDLDYDMEDALKTFAQDEYVQEGPLAPQMPMAQAQAGGTGLFDTQAEGAGLVDTQADGAGMFANVIDTDSQGLNDILSLSDNNLSKVFYTRAYSSPVSGRLKDALPKIFDESKTLFYLYGGQEAFSELQGASQALDEMDKNEKLGSTEKSYGAFLTAYLKDPSKFRSGKNFEDLVYRVRDVLNEAANNPAIDIFDTGFDTKDFWIRYMFGPEGSPTAKRNRQNLVKINAAKGRVHAGTLAIHRGIDERWTRYDQLGWTPEQIFNKMVGLTTSPSSRTEEMIEPDTTTLMAEDMITPDPATEAILDQASFGGGPGRVGINGLPSQVDPVPDMASIEAILDQVPLPQQAVGPAAFGGGPGRGGISALPELEAEQVQDDSSEYWKINPDVIAAANMGKQAWNYGDISAPLKRQIGNVDKMVGNVGDRVSNLALQAFNWRPSMSDMGNVGKMALQAFNWRPSQEEQMSIEEMEEIDNILNSSTTR